MATPEELLDGAEEVLAAALSFVDDCAGGSHSTTNDAGSGLCLTVPGVDGAALLDLEGHPSPFSDIWPSTPRSASPYDLLSIEPCASPPPLLLGAIALDAPIRHGPSSHPSLQPQTTSARARTAGRSKAAGASRKCHRNSNRVRDEERKEVLRLRSLVAELETRITLLREAKRSTKRVVPQPSSCTGDERVIRIWRESTKLQFEQRLKALGENGRLRQLLERQVKIASALRQLVQNQAAAQVRPSLQQCSCVGYLEAVTHRDHVVMTRRWRTVDSDKRPTGRVMSYALQARQSSSVACSESSKPRTSDLTPCSGPAACLIKIKSCNVVGITRPSAPTLLEL